jgi:hypothetical protein
MNKPSVDLDSAKVAGLLVLGAVVTLAVTRRAFGGVRVNLGD